MEVQPADLHSPLTLILSSLAAGLPKTLLCSGSIQDVEVLQKRVGNVYQETRVRPGILERVSNSVRQRAVEITRK